MVIVLGLTIIIKEITARYAKFLSSKIASGLLHADAWHHRTDAISSFLVMIALVAGNFGYPSIDGWVGFLVALILILTEAGALLIEALARSNDQQLAGAIIFLLTATIVFVNFVTDILLAIMDPRIRKGVMGGG